MRQFSVRAEASSLRRAAWISDRRAGGPFLEPRVASALRIRKGKSEPGARRWIAVRYLAEMRKPRQTPEEAEAKRAYLMRGHQIRAGTVPGLFETGSKRVRPEIRELIETAVAKKGLS